jgi:hypothetical protein
LKRCYKIVKVAEMLKVHYWRVYAAALRLGLPEAGGPFTAEEVRRLRRYFSSPSTD